MYSNDIFVSDLYSIKSWIYPILLFIKNISRCNSKDYEFSQKNNHQNQVYVHTTQRHKKIIINVQLYMWILNYQQAHMI